MFDEITIKRIEILHPNIREDVKNWYLEINRKLPKGVRLRFTHTYRTNAEQDALFNQKTKVTNAKGGQSIHNYGLAFDIVILKEINGKWVADWKIDKYWLQVADYFKSKGFAWGGDWTSFKDYPHFEVKGYKWQYLQKKEVFVSNGLKYPKL